MHHPEASGSARTHLATSSLGAAGSLTWTPDLAFFYPFLLTDWAVAKQLLFFVGSVSSGNIDMGIYTSQGNRIVSAGSTAMGTTNTVQELNITDTTLAPGEYALGVVCDDGSGSCQRTSFADEDANASFYLLEQQDVTSATLPATATWSVTTVATVPIWVIGIQFRSVF